MVQTVAEKPFCVSIFTGIGQAEQAVKRLLAAGFTKDEVAVVCPEQYKDRLSPGIPRADRPGSNAVEGTIGGGVAGAALGGIALAATAIATGGVGILPALPVLVGGGALAGGFSGLILSDGYGKKIGQYYEEAIRLNKIVVGVEVEGEGGTARLIQAQQILENAGGNTSPETS